MSIASDVQEALTNPHRLFIVNSVLDLTENIVVPSYKVNLVDGYDEWVDNNKVLHRDRNSSKVNGTFELLFYTQEEFFTFLATLKASKKSNLAYDCSVYCVNTMEVLNVELFIEYEPANVAPFIGRKVYDAIEITVSQRGNQYVPVS